MSENKSLFPIGFGGAALSGEGGGYGFGKISEEDSISLARYAQERGVQIFDTAPIYGFGTSEVRLGKAFKQNREKVQIVSKSGIDWHSTKRVNLTNDPKITQRMLDDSLRRLDSDYIDIYMIHWPDERVDIRRPMEVLAKALDQKKILSIGLCNTNLEDLKKASEIGKIGWVQSEINFIERDNIEPFRDFLSDQNISVMAWGTLGKGLLTGKVSRKREAEKDYDESDCRKKAPWWKSKDILKIADDLAPILKAVKDCGFSPLEMALAHNIGFEGLDVSLVGAKSPKQLDEILNVFGNLPDEELVCQAIVAYEKNKRRHSDL